VSDLARSLVATINEVAFLLDESMFLPVGHLKYLDKLGVIGAVEPDGELLEE
jgi:hypothetical protein